jgi:probable F420-dependent oxidoreductase
MKFGLAIPNHGESTNADEQVNAAKTAEEYGYDSVWTDDHIIVPKKFEKEYGFMNEALITLAFIAARTEKIKLGTSVIVVPQRNPILLAKQVATIDNLSDGRAILGVGVGWMEDEFKLLGASGNFAKRGSFLDESIRLMRELWMADPVNFKGRYFEITNGVFLPKPRQSIPIWVGGMSDAAIRRASKLADVYHPLWTTPEGLEVRVRKLRGLDSKVPVSLRMPVDMHRNRTVIVRTSGTKMQQIAGSSDKILKEIEKYVHAGMQHLLVEFDAENAKMLQGDIKTFAQEIMNSFT